MIKNVLTQIDFYSFCAELSMILFAGVFIAITVRTLFTKADITAAQALVVLDDNREVRHDD